MAKSMNSQKPAWSVTVLTLFPEMFPGPLAYSLAGRALEDGIWALETVDIRAFARLRDGGDSPFGWRKFMVSQQDYIRFCCFVTILELVGGRDDPQLAGG